MARWPNKKEVKFIMNNLYIGRNADGTPRRGVFEWEKVVVHGYSWSRTEAQCYVPITCWTGATVSEAEDFIRRAKADPTIIPGLSHAPAARALSRSSCDAK